MPHQVIWPSKYFSDDSNNTEMFNRPILMADYNAPPPNVGFIKKPVSRCVLKIRLFLVRVKVICSVNSTKSPSNVCYIILTIITVCYFCGFYCFQYSLSLKKGHMGVCYLVPFASEIIYTFLSKNVITIQSVLSLNTAFIICSVLPFLRTFCSISSRLSIVPFILIVALHTEVSHSQLVNSWQSEMAL